MGTVFNRKQDLFPAGIIIIAAFLLFLFGYFFYQNEKETIYQYKSNELNTINQIKTEQISNWLKERISEVEYFTENPPYDNYIVSLTQGKTNATDLYRKALQHISTNSRYENIFILDNRGKILFSLDEKFSNVDAETLRRLDETRQSGQFSIQDLYYCNTDQKIHFEIIKPIKDPNGGVIASIFFRTDPRTFLFPLISNWMRHNDTEESLLVTNDQHQVRFLNHVRHEDNSRLQITIDLGNKKNLEVQAVLGLEGITEGLDYRGEKVLASIRKVPGTTWLLIVKMDKQEMYMVLNRNIVWIMSVVLLLMVTVSVLLAWLHYRKQRNIYRELFINQTELYQAQEEYGATLYSIGDGVITTDQHGNVKHLNPKAEKLTCWKEADARGVPVEKVFNIIHEYTREPVESPVRQVLQEGRTVGLANHTLLIAKDGTEIPISDSGAPIKDSQGNLLGVVLVFSDQIAERERRKLLMLRLSMFEYAIDHSLQDILTKMIDEISRLFQSPIGLISLLTEDQQSVRMQSWSSNVTNQIRVNEPTGSYQTKGTESWKEVTSSKQPVVHNDCAASCEKNVFFENQNQIFRELIVPVIRKNRVVALLGLANKPTDYTEQDIEIASFLSDVAWEISDHKIHEEKLIESEKKFRKLFQEHSAVKLIIDPETGCIVDANQAAANFYGWSINELTTMKISQINTLPEDVIRQKMNEARSNRNIHFEFKHKKANGEIVDIENFSSRVILGGKELLHSIIHDISEKKRAIAALLESEEQNRLIMDNSMDAILLTQPNGKILTANKSATALFQMSLEELKNSHRDQLLNAEEPNPADLSKLLKKSELTNTQLRFFRKDGSTFPAEVSMAQFKNQKEEYFTSMIIRDITERARWERELLDAKEKAEESDRLKSAFLANMSHEIRTPMNGILGFLGLLQQDNLNKDNRLEYLKIVNKSGHRLLDTINDIIEISKIEAGEQKLTLSQTDLDEMIRFQYDFFKPQAAEKGIKLSIAERISSERAMVMTDKIKLSGILTNLIKNAIKFTSRGSVEIGSYIQEDSSIFFIKDTGLGIPEEKKDLIFKRFIQADMRISRDHEGSGLGLSITKAYVDTMKGKIWVESIPGKGSSFFVSIPYHPIQNQNKANEQPENIQEQPINPIIILVAEDDQISYQYLEILLKKENLNLIRATNGIEAIEKLKENAQTAMILMDVKMPVMDGLKATQEIRKFNKDIPIIAQTAYAFPEDKRKTEEAGCNDYIVKPINKHILLEKIKKYAGS